ncbi:DUF3290 domain-containing protein [Ligilactobacillus murinus]|uniref:DUF3290 domain-containing protein n=2 Tax=Ligilactobacillus murinus TaxID=1622 RepID=A0A4Q2AYA1_9LACO|nr:DUF3290 domain-containing protein [Ligilactobacillus murinus]NBH85066.1 DUF3290 domain-containing protein [Lachnospiraceae bacterium]USF22375.1 hypothetical protein C822_001655 [Ligilactobacillus murinus ASF361]MBF0701219.1 DUF3290 domain-containing protein [Ligilactobacillus murinus]MCR1880057.1 DUF3290 domain-containing protein [Ligilactobacillus murinus]MCZ0673816.1 DUF3290 domain-containing protein [Ligilactobacillus murinus]
MTFYTLQYLQNQREVNQLVIYSLSALGLLILLFAVFMYSRNRFDTKYRDISIIMLLVMFFLFGLSYSNYEQHRTQTLSTSQVQPFLRSVARDEGVSTKDVAVNSRSLVEGIIVKVKDKYYRVELSVDRNSYELARTHLINKDITIQ